MSQGIRILRNVKSLRTCVIVARVGEQQLALGETLIESPPVVHPTPKVSLLGRLIGRKPEVLPTPAAPMVADKCVPEILLAVLDARPGDRLASQRIYTKRKVFPGYTRLDCLCAFFVKLDDPDEATWTYSGPGLHLAFRNRVAFLRMRRYEFDDGRPALQEFSAAEVEEIAPMFGFEVGGE